MTAYFHKIKKNKKKIFFSGILCLFITLILISIFPMKKYSIEFTANINHVYFRNYSIGNNVTDIINLINISKVDSTGEIILTYQKLSNTFLAKSNNQNMHKELELIFKNALKNELDIIFNIIEFNEIKSNKDCTKTNANGLINWCEHDILNIGKEAILEKFIINFGKVKYNYQNKIILLFSFFLGVYISIYRIIRSKK